MTEGRETKWKKNDGVLCPNSASISEYAMIQSPFGLRAGTFLLKSWGIIGDLSGAMLRSGADRKMPQIQKHIGGQVFIP